MGMRATCAGDTRFVVADNKERRLSVWLATKKANIRLPRKRNSHFHGARPVYYNHLDDKWIRTSRLPIKKSLSHWLAAWSHERQVASLARRFRALRRAGGGRCLVVVRSAVDDHLVC